MTEEEIRLRHDIAYYRHHLYKMYEKVCFYRAAFLMVVTMLAVLVGRMFVDGTLRVWWM